MIDALRLFVIVALLCCSACNSSPSAPSPVAPPPPPRIADAPTLACPAGPTVSAPTSAGIPVSYQTPASEHGEGSVTVRCTPQPGAMFPIGTTPVECVATD